jgi:hypothetical protein
VANVRFGPKADISQRKRHVRFTPKNGHSHRKQRCLLRASSGHFVMTRGDPKLIFFRVFEHPTRITKKSGPSEGKMEDSFKIVTGSGAIGLSCFFC